MRRSPSEAIEVASEAGRGRGSGTRPLLSATVVRGRCGGNGTAEIAGSVGSCDAAAGSDISGALAAPAWAVMTGLLLTGAAGSAPALGSGSTFGRGALP